MADLREINEDLGIATKLVDIIDMKCSRKKVMFDTEALLADIDKSLKKSPEKEIEKSEESEED